MMKKFLFFCFLLFVVSSCKEDKINYTIEGKINSSDYEEFLVYLLAMNQETYLYEKIDSTTIKDSTFLFKGYCDTTALAAVLFPKLSSIPVVIEPGNISMSIAADFKTTLVGTSLNDSLQSFFTQVNQLQEVKNPIIDSLVVKSKKDSLCSQMDSIDNELNNRIFHFMKNNIHNVLGESFAYTYINQLEIENQEVLLRLAPNRFRALPKIQQAINRIDDVKKTVNNQVKSFEAKNSNDKKVKFSDFVKKDRVILLNFWASWSAVCMEDEIPYLQKLHTSYGKKGLNIVSVSLDNDISAWKKTIDKPEMNWTHLIDSAFTASKAFQVDVNTIPQSFLINKQGEVIGINLPKETLDKKIQELLDDGKLRN